MLILLARVISGAGDIVRRWGFVFLILALGVGPVDASEVVNSRGMVASGHPLATRAGVKVLQQGGNAIDAAVAVGLTLGVVDTQNSGIGGGCFMLIRLANGKIVAIDGRETAPAAATRDMFLRDGKADTRLSQTGALASGVPGELAAFDYAVRKHGRKSLRDLLLPAADLAEGGFRITPGYARRLTAVAEDLASFPESKRIFLPDGKPLAVGDILKQPELAATYRSLAEHGIDWFYRGPFAARVEGWMRQNGGLLASNDFAAYRIELRHPVETRYRDYRVISFPPPSSGGVHLLQMLNMVERFDLAAMEPADRLHVMAEAMKLAFADRAYWLGDPDFVKVPRGLIAKRYASDLAKSIDLNRAASVTGHGTPPNWERNVFKHTTHFSVADDLGNWVACTATINTSFGSKVVIPGTGVVMNNQMDDFSTQPGVANYFGLIGAEANAIAPKKRPLSSMTPTLVFRGRHPIIAVGAAGGPKIISGVFQELVAMLDLGCTPDEALAQPRVHHQWSPDELVVEKSLPDSERIALEAKGHKIVVQNALSVSHIVARDLRAKQFRGAADPRGDGAAQGW